MILSGNYFHAMVGELQDVYFYQTLECLLRSDVIFSLSSSNSFT
jgi:hypothetical protein